MDNQLVDEEEIHVPRLVPEVYVPEEPAAGGARKRTRARCWCFTSFDAAPPQFHEDTRYICYQQEMCPDTGRTHWQGYVEFNRKVEFNTAKSILGERVHIEVRRGTQEQAIDYTKKPETAVEGTWTEVGTKAPPDAVSMMQQIAECIQNGATNRDIARKHTRGYILWHRGIAATRQALRPKPEKYRHMTCICLWGATGVRKTTWAWNTFEDPYAKDSKESFWEQYEDQKAVIFDEFYGQLLPSQMQTFLGERPFIMNVKGSSGCPYYHVCVVTSNVDPTQWWSGGHVPEEVRKSIYRRLHYIVHVPSLHTNVTQEVMTQMARKLYEQFNKERVLALRTEATLMHRDFVCPFDLQSLERALYLFAGDVLTRANCMCREQAKYIYDEPHPLLDSDLEVRLRVCDCVTMTRPYAVAYRALETMLPKCIDYVPPAQQPQDAGEPEPVLPGSPALSTDRPVSVRLPSRRRSRSAQERAALL